MLAEWFIYSNGASIGPYSHEQIWELFSQGSLQSSSLIRRLDGPWLAFADVFPPSYAPAADISNVSEQPQTVNIGYSVPGEWTEPVSYELPRNAFTTPGESDVPGNPFRSPERVVKRHAKKSSANQTLIFGAAVIAGGLGAIVVGKGILSVIAPPAQTEIVEAPTETETDETTIRRPKQSTSAGRPLPRPAAPPKAVDRSDEPSSVTSTNAPKLPTVGTVATGANTSGHEPVNGPVMPSPSGSGVSIPNPLPIAIGGAPVTPAPKNATPDDEAIDWLKVQESIDRQRDVLILKIADVRRQSQPLIDRAQGIDSDCRPKELEISRLKKQAANISNGIMLLRQSGDDSSQLEVELRSILASIHSLSTTVQQQRAEYRKVMTSVNAFREQEQQLYREADSLRAELVRHLNPFAPVSDPVAKVAFEYFGRPVPDDNGVVKAWSEFGLACIHLRKRNEDEAEKHFQAAMALDLSEGTFRAVRGYRLLLVGEDDAALAELVAALKDSPENWTVNYLRALYHCRKGSHSTAEMFLRKCRDCDKKNYRGPALLALLKSASSDDKVRNANFAKQFADEALSIAKTHTTHLAMAAALAESGDAVNALAHAQSALKLRPDPVNDFCRRCVETLSGDRVLRVDWKTFEPWIEL
jgi:tetratricopeptide (TPR) repeat protein